MSEKTVWQHVEGMLDSMRKDGYFVGENTTEIKGLKNSVVRVTASFLTSSVSSVMPFTVIDEPDRSPEEIEAILDFIKSGKVLNSKKPRLHIVKE